MMRKAICSLVLLCGLVGCGVVENSIENSLTDIDGWDLSACVDGFGTCWELFNDNSDRILGGEVTIINNLSPQAWND